MQLRNTLIFGLSIAGIAVAGWRLSSGDTVMPMPLNSPINTVALSTANVFSPRLETHSNPNVSGYQPSTAPGVQSGSSTGGASITTKSTQPVSTVEIETQGDLINLRAVRQAVEAWRLAWEKKDHGAYLGFYHAEFRGRALFSSQKRRVMSRAKFIQVRLKDLEVEEESINRFQVSFQQTYSSDNYVSTVEKIQVWVLVDGQLRIVSERSIEND
ncbi:MAG: L,D-transpeptidase Cds6 family protein [Burkholderiaceae bacterium]